VQNPEYLKTPAYTAAAGSGAIDLIIYDRHLPVAMPEANTFFIGNVPPAAGWSRGKTQPTPFIVDSDRAHPLTYLVEMGSVRHIFEGFAIKGPAGATNLIEASIGPILVIAHRGGFEDAALGLEIVGPDEKGEVFGKTDWPSRPSFPVFVLNTVTYLSGLQGTLAVAGVQPGSPITLRSQLPVDRVRVTAPSGGTADVFREGQNAFTFSGTDEIGVYEVREGASNEVAQRFAVNLLDSQESNLVPRPQIELGFETVQGQPATRPTRRELWKPLLLSALGVLLFEWYVFNRRVYL
jgi:hypothetical protein